MKQVNYYYLLLSLQRPTARCLIYVLGMELIPQARVLLLLPLMGQKLNLVPLLTFSPGFSEDGDNLDIFSSCYSYLRLEKSQHFRIFSASILVTLPRIFKENTNYLNEGKKKEEIKGEKEKQYRQYIKNMILSYILSDLFLSTIPLICFIIHNFQVKK